MSEPIHNLQLDELAANIRLIDLKYLAVVAHAKGMSEAARLLGVKQPTLSKAITKLEDHLGFPLFVRDARPIQLTEEGTTLAESAVRILRQYHGSLNALPTDTKDIEGALRIAVAPWVLDVMGYEALQALHNAMPKMQLQVLYPSRAQREDAIAADLLIDFMMPTTRKVRKLPLFTMRRVFYASKEYIAQAPPMTEISNITHHPCIIYQYSGYESQYVPPSISDSVKQLLGGLHPVITYENYECAIRMCMLGMGLILVPEGMVEARAEAREKLVRVFPDEAYESQVFAMYPPFNVLPPKLSATLEVLDKYMRKRNK